MFLEEHSGKTLSSNLVQSKQVEKLSWEVGNFIVCKYDFNFFKETRDKAKNSNAKCNLYLSHQFRKNVDRCDQELLSLKE